MNLRRDSRNLKHRLQRQGLRRNLKHRLQRQGLRRDLNHKSNRRSQPLSLRKVNRRARTVSHRKGRVSIHPDPRKVGDISSRVRGIRHRTEFRDSITVTPLPDRPGRCR